MTSVHNNTSVDASQGGFPAETFNEPTKVENVANEIFHSPVFKSMMSLVGFVTVTIGSLFMKDIFTEMFKDKRVEVKGASIDSKVFIDNTVSFIEEKAKKFLKTKIDANPLSKEIFGAIVDWQKAAEAEEIKRK